MKATSVRILWITIGLLFVLNFAVWTNSKNSGDLTVAFLDVGQGDAIFIEAPNGNQMIIDAGPNAAVLRELSKVVGFFDRKIDIIVMSHPDLDHIGGFPDLLKRFDASFVIHPGVSGSSGAYDATLSNLDQKGVDRFIAERGMRVYLDKDVYMDILFPDRNASGLETNTASIVGKLVYGNSSFMLMGDAPQGIEKYLVAIEGENLKSDVLKAGHHGSRTSSSELFVKAVAPEFSVISAGIDNRYGHPHREVVEIFENTGIEILGTYKEGRIVFKSDGQTIRRK